MNAPEPTFTRSDLAIVVARAVGLAIVLAALALPFALLVQGGQP